MTRFAALDLSSYPVADVLEALTAAAYVARDRATFDARWAARRAVDPTLPALDAAALESDPSSAIMEVGAYRETLLRARVNDALRSVTLAGALDKNLEHIGITYYRAPRLPGEGDERYRQRLALAPESWSTAGPEGAYLYWALGASSDVRDVAVYSEDEGVCLAPTVRAVVLSASGREDCRDTLATVATALNRREIRPYGDRVIVEAARPQGYRVALTLMVRSGSSAEVVRAAALQQVQAYVSGRMRWIGDGEAGPVQLVGRRIRVGSLAAAGRVAGVEEVIVREPLADVNAPPPAYASSLPLPLNAQTALHPSLTAHLFVAPVCVEIEIVVETIGAGWAS